MRQKWWNEAKLSTEFEFHGDGKSEKVWVILGHKFVVFDRK